MAIILILPSKAPQVVVHFLSLSFRHETWFFCVASLFLKVFISRAEIKWWSDYADNSLGFVRYWVAVLFFSSLLGFHFLPFRNRFCYPLQIHREKNNSVLFSRFFRCFFFSRYKCKNYNYNFSCYRSDRKHSKSLSRQNIISSSNSTIICNNCLLILLMPAIHYPIYKVPANRTLQNSE